ncbi:hypothetical protein VNO77_15639 [Canavalia gladiata]|uniref:KASH domain-containing protein n=1 Tax=Canavalia gladiata TaxID=3824 RepID=A0AAN9M2W0_CANGL
MAPLPSTFFLYGACMLIPRCFDWSCMASIWLSPSFLSNHSFTKAPIPVLVARIPGASALGTLKRLPACLWFLTYGILDEGEKSLAFFGATKGIVKVLRRGFGFSLILFETSMGRPFLLSFYDHPQSHLCESGIERTSRLWLPKEHPLPESMLLSLLAPSWEVTWEVVRVQMGVLPGAGCRLGNLQEMQLQGLSTHAYPNGVGNHGSALVHAWLGVTFYIWLGLKTTPVALSFSAITLSKKGVSTFGH